MQKAIKMLSWLFHRRRLREDNRIIARGILALLKGQADMSEKIEAFRASLDAFLARQAALVSEVQPLKDQLTAVMAERDEANAALVEATTKMDAA